MKIPEIKELLEIVKEAGDAVHALYNKVYTIQEKEDETPVTEADLLSQSILEKKLKKYKIPLLTEETEDDLRRLNSDLVCIIDPLDGTSDFIQKTDEYAIMLGIVQIGIPVMGIVYSPAHNALYYAQREKGAWKRQHSTVTRLSVSTKSQYSEMTALISRNHLLPTEEKFIQQHHIGNTTVMGSAGLKLSRIAEGKADIYINSSDRTCEWDTCAGACILAEAGGILTDLVGQPITYNKKHTTHLKGFLATNATIHSKIIDDISGINTF